MADKKPLPLTYLFLSIIGMVTLHFALPGLRLTTFPWNLLGLLPLLSGVALNLVADKTFQRAGTTVKPFQESTTLLTTGVFRFSRHPMYLGFVLILLGIAILMGSLTPFTVVILFWILMHAVFVRVEEQMLEEKFGAAWIEYQSRVRRWLSL